MRETLRTPGELIAAGLAAPEQAAALQAVARRYALAIPPALAALIDPFDPHDPIARQFVPDAAELHITPDELADRSCTVIAPLVWEILPPATSSSVELLPVPLMLALIAMVVVAFKVSMLLLDQLTGLATVIEPPLTELEAFDAVVT